MIKQLSRGYLFFSGKTIEDVIRVFGNFKLDDIDFLFFSEIEINNNIKQFPGVYLNGNINEKFTSENIVRLFRKLMGMSLEKKDSDIGVEKEQKIEPVLNVKKYKHCFYFKIKIQDLERLKQVLEEKVDHETKITSRESEKINRQQILVIEIFSVSDRIYQIKNKLLEQGIDYYDSIKISFT